MQMQTATFNEVNQHAGSLSCWPQEYDQVTAGPFEGFLQDIHFDSVRLFRERMNQSVAQHTHIPAGRLSLLIPIHLNCNKTSDQARCVLATGITLLPCDQDFFFVAPPETDYAVVSIDKNSLRHLLTEEDYQNLLQTHRSYGIPLRPDRLDSSKQYLLNLLTQLSQTEAEAIPDGISHRQEQAIRDQLILMVMDICDTARMTHKPLGNQHHYIVRRCHDYVLSAAGETASMLDICQELGVPRRTLNYSFEKVTGNSPAQYLRAIKLNAARRQLLTTDLSVTAVAANYGFFHSGYFSQEYRRLFAETPSATRGRPAAISINQ